MKRCRKLFALMLCACMVITGMFSNILSKQVHAAEKSKTLKILAIGNSFSQDAQRWLYQIAEDAGYEDIVIANLYWGGCSLWQHWQNAQNDYAGYEYQKNTTGDIEYIANVSIKTAVTDEEWDFITLQQVSGDSGRADTYNSDLTNLVDYVKKHARKSSVKLGWHMTWAYQSDSNHGDFAKYGNNQMTMYNGIINAVQTKILTNNNFSFVIPAGTAIQNLRTSFLGDTLTRDGYHMSYQLGRYVVGLTWIYEISKQMGLDLPTQITYTPSRTEVPPEYLPAIREAVGNAIRNPLSVTNSSYTNSNIQKILDSNNYEVLDWQPQCYGYWNSTDNSTYDIITTNSDISKNYIASGVRFDREQLPLGSVIIVENGYQYRPEGWVQLGQKNPYARPDYVSQYGTVVTSAWWGQYNFRGFNLYKSDGKTSGITAAQARNVLKIYVPSRKSDLQTNKEYVITSQSSGKALAIANESTANNAALCQMTPSNSDSQIWTLQDAGDGYFFIVNKRSGKVLDVPGASTEAGKGIIQYNKTNGDNQKWKVVDEGNGCYKIVPKRTLNQALDVSGNSSKDGAPIVQWTYSGADNQKWKFEVAGSSQPQANKSFKIVAKSSGKAMAVQNSSRDNEAVICQMSLANSNAQVWTLQDAGDGYYYIINKLSGKALDVPKAAAEAGTEMIQYDKNNGDNQKWKIVDVGLGYYRITPKRTPEQALDVSGNSGNDGAAILQWKYNGADNQKWQFQIAN